MYSKLSGEQNLNKLPKFFDTFITTPDEVKIYAHMMQSISPDYCVHRNNIEILSLFDPELQLINTKSMTKSKLKIILK